MTTLCLEDLDLMLEDLISEEIDDVIIQSTVQSVQQEPNES